MAFLLFVSIWVAILLLSSKWLHPKIQRALAYRRAQRQYGATRAPRYPNRLPWGYDNYKSLRDARQQGRMMRYFDERYQQLGHTWEENTFGRKVIHTIDTTNIQHVLTLQFEDFDRGSSAARFFLGDGIFSSNGGKWKWSRNLMKPTFSRTEIGNIEPMKMHVDRLFELIPRDGSTFDMQPLVKKLFLDTASEFLFGTSMDSLLPGLDAVAAEEFLKNFETGLSGADERGWAGLMKIRYLFDKDWPKAVAKVHDFIDVYVKRALETPDPDNEKPPIDTESKESEASPPSERYVLLYEMAKYVRDPVELRSQILNVFMASRDTTGILVSNVLFQLARHPKYWTKLRETALALNEEEMSFESLKGLKPFRHVIFETQRTIGPTGVIPRTANKNTTLPHGGGPDGQAPIFLAKGDRVFVFMYSHHHKEEVFGEDPYEFRPERFERLRSLTWEWIPFSGGPRICPALNQVIIQTTYLLVRLTRAFERIENRDPVLKYIEFPRMLTESKNGVKIGLIPAKDGVR